MHRILTCVTVIAIGLVLTGCAGIKRDHGISRGAQGAAGGAAAGAIAGQAIGEDTESTLLGAGIGTVGGYIAGNEMDKADHRRRHAQPRGRSRGGGQTQTTATTRFEKPIYDQQGNRIGTTEVQQRSTGRSNRPAMKEPVKPGKVYVGEPPQAQPRRQR